RAGWSKSCADFICSRKHIQAPAGRSGRGYAEAVRRRAREGGLMDLRVYADTDALAVAAAELFRSRVAAMPALAMAVPAGRTPRQMYALMRAQQVSAPVDFTRMRVFCVDELCPPA